MFAFFGTVAPLVLGNPWFWVNIAIFTVSPHVFNPVFAGPPGSLVLHLTACSPNIPAPHRAPHRHLKVTLPVEVTFAVMLYLTFYHGQQFARFYDYFTRCVVCQGHIMNTAT